MFLGLCTLFSFVLFSTIFTGCKGKDGEIGPAGANGSNGTNGIDGLDGVDGVDANSFCRDCHNAANWSAVIAQLESSKHGDREGNMAEEGQRKDCAKCHSAQGFLATLENGLDTPSVNYGSNSQWAASTNFTLTCNVCHEFHGTLDETDFPNYALRHIPAFAPIANKSITWDFGGSNACMSCHQNRPNTSVKIAGVTVGLDTIPDATMVQITSQRYGGHHGPQGQLYAGVGKGSYEVTGTATYANSTMHSSLICGDCHILSTADNTDKTGGHYYKLADRNETTHAVIAGTENVSKCVSCHSSATNHNINNVQTDVKQLMLDIETKLISKNIMKNSAVGTNGYGGVNTDGYILGDNGTGNASSSNPRTVTAKQAKAIYNFKCIYEDYSYGVHNPTYFKALLTNSKAVINTL